MGYQSDYARTVADIYGQLGQGQAQARLQQGNAWANAFGQIGQTVAQIPGQIQEQKRQAKVDQLNDLQMQQVQANIDDARTNKERNGALATLVSQSMKDGKLDAQAFMTAASAAGLAQYAPAVMTPILAAERVLFENDVAGDANEDRLADRQMRYATPYAIALVENAFDPQALLATYAAMRGQMVPEKVVQRFENMDAKGLVSFATPLVPKPKLTEGFTVPEGGKRLEPVVDKYGRQIISADGRPSMHEFKGPEKPKSLSERFAAAKTGQERADIAQLMRQEAQAKYIAPAPSTTRYQRAEVTLPDGTTALANFDSQTGKYTDVDTGQVLSGVTGAPTAEQRNKAAARADAVGMIDMLKQMSDRIIKRVGPTQRADAARRGVAAVFGNDPDFKVYQDLRYSLAMNLAVMQQGSRPTDPDVQKGALPVVPDPFSDTSDSATMKWNYVDTLVRPKKAGANPSGGGGGVPTPTGMVRMLDTNDVEQFVPSANVAKAEAGGWKRSGG